MKVFDCNEYNALQLGSNILKSTGYTDNHILHILDGVIKCDFEITKPKKLNKLMNNIICLYVNKRTGGSYSMPWI